jgi:hypothetical protein
MGHRLLLAALLTLAPACATEPLPLPSSPPNSHLLEPIDSRLDAPPRAQEDFVMSLNREYGLSPYRVSRLDVVAYQYRVGATLSREVWELGGTYRTVEAREGLGTLEGNRLISLVKRAQLYDGGHIGMDATASDGLFETIRFNGHRGAVVLVTSHNPSFEQNAERSELLRSLRRLPTGPNDAGVHACRPQADCRDPTGVSCGRNHAHRDESDRRQGVRCLSATWVGGTYRFARWLDSWRLDSISSWIT